MKADFNFSGVSNIKAPNVGDIFSGFGETLRQNRLADELLKRQEREDAWKAEEREYLKNKREKEEELLKSKQNFFTTMLKGPQEISGGITNAMSKPKYQNILDNISLTPEELDKMDFETYSKIKDMPFEQLSKSQQNLVSKYSSLSPEELQSKASNPLSFDEQLSIEKKLNEQQNLSKLLTDSYKPQYESQSELVSRAANELKGPIPDFVYQEMKNAKSADIEATKNLRESLKQDISKTEKEKVGLEKELEKFKTTHNADGSTKSTKSSSGKNIDYADYAVEMINRLNTPWFPETLVPFTADDIERFGDALNEWQANEKDIKYIDQAMKYYAKPGILAELNLPDKITTADIIKKAEELEKEAKSGKYGKGDNSYTKFLEKQIKELDKTVDSYNTDLSTLLQGKASGRDLPLQQAVDEFVGNRRNRDIAFNNRVVTGPDGNRYLYDTLADANEARKSFEDESSLYDKLSKKKSTSKTKSNIDTSGTSTGTGDSINGTYSTSLAEDPRLKGVSPKYKDTEELKQAILEGKEPLSTTALTDSSTIVPKSSVRKTDADIAIMEQLEIDPDNMAPLAIIKKIDESKDKNGLLNPDLEKAKDYYIEEQKKLVGPGNYKAGINAVLGVSNAIGEGGMNALDWAQDRMQEVFGRSVLDKDGNWSEKAAEYFAKNKDELAIEYAKMMGNEVTPDQVKTWYNIGAATSPFGPKALKVTGNKVKSGVRSLINSGEKFAKNRRALNALLDGIEEGTKKFDANKASRLLSRAKTNTKKIDPYELIDTLIAKGKTPEFILNILSKLTK